jgi:ABC-type transporter Mla subunit MlaD
MTRKSLLLSIAALAITVAPASANLKPHAAAQLDQIVAAAKTIQTDAQDVSTLLRAKTPNFDRVSEKMQVMGEHSTELNRLIEQLEAANTEATPAQRAEFDRMKELAQLVNIFVANKSDLLSAPRRERNVLRAKADGIAKRAGLLQQSAQRVRG